MRKTGGIKCNLCADHFERLVDGTPCESCPSIPEHEAVVRMLANHEEDASPLTRGMLSEVRSIRTSMEMIQKSMEGFHERVTHCEHTVFGNGSPGLKTQMAVMADRVSENKGRPQMILSICATAVAMLAALAAFMK